MRLTTVEICVDSLEMRDRLRGRALVRFLRYLLVPGGQMLRIALPRFGVKFQNVANEERLSGAQQVRRLGAIMVVPLVALMTACAVPATSSPTLPSVETAVPTPTVLAGPTATSVPVQTPTVTATLPPTPMPSETPEPTPTLRPTGIREVPLPRLEADSDVFKLVPKEGLGWDQARGTVREAYLRTISAVLDVSYGELMRRLENGEPLQEGLKPGEVRLSYPVYDPEAMEGVRERLETEVIDLSQEAVFVFNDRDPSDVRGLGKTSTLEIDISVSSDAQLMAVFYVDTEYAVQTPRTFVCSCLGIFFGYLYERTADFDPDESRILEDGSEIERLLWNPLSSGHNDPLIYGVEKD